MAGNTASLPQDLTATTTMWLAAGESSVEIRATLAYSANDPFSVTLGLSLGADQAVEWVFARELLIDGVHLPVGQGDIHIYPTFGELRINLQSPDGSATLAADLATMRQFADDMQATVALGNEHEFFSFDDELAELLEFAGERPIGA